MTDWSEPNTPDMEPGSDHRVRLGFERETVTVALDQLVPLKILQQGVRESKKFAQILSSIKAIGIVEAPAVAPDPKNAGKYFLLDGHLRVEALRQLEIPTVECLVANDDETYTYNKRVNRLPPVQEHRMIVRAIERGVTEGVIADALGLEVQSIRARFRLLDDICTEAADALKDIRVIIPDNAHGEVVLSEGGIQPSVRLHGNLTTAAVDSLKVVAFDLAALILSIEGKTQLPGFWLHDSPREADLGLPLYHRLFDLVRTLEGLTTAPLFQYIITTTTRPPTDLQVAPWLILQLSSAPAEMRLFERDL